MAGDLLIELDAVRLANLQTQIELLLRDSPFYELKFNNVDPHVMTSMSQIDSLPFTTNEEIKAAGPFGLLLRSAQPEAYYESSGTSGHPTSGFPDLSAEKSASFGAFLDQWMSLRNERIKRALVCLAYEMNPTGIRFQMALPHAGVTVIPAGVRTTICPPETVLGLIEKLDVQAIFSRPFEVLRLGDALKIQGKDPAESSILKIFMLGEPISRSKWQRISELWGDADLYAHYGLTEVDTGLQTCKEGFYHEPSSPFAHFYLVDKNLRQISDDGSHGEIVISVLKKAHAPLINYRTGDLAVRFTSRCPCGLHTPRFEIIGRESDGLNLGTTTVYPIEIENEVFKNNEIGNEYLFLILEDGSLHLILERAFGSETRLSLLAEKVGMHLKESLSINTIVEVREFGSIADKLGIAKKKSAKFTDLRGLSSAAKDDELRVNVIDSQYLKTGTGIAITI